MAGEKDVKIRINTEANTAGAKEAQQSMASLEAEVKRLKEELRNASIGSEEFEDLSSRIGAAERKLEEATAQAKAFARGTDQASSAAKSLSHGTDQVNGSVKSFGPQIQNTAYQLQDLAVQIGGGTSAFRALGQQLPQMLTGFGPMAAIIGAVVAGLPLLVTLLTQTGDKAEESGPKFKGYKDALKDL